MGDDAQRFLESDLGRFVLARADEEKQAALLALVEVDAEDSKRIRDLQTVVWRANSFAGWLIELIHRGRDAETTLMTEEEHGRE